MKGIENMNYQDFMDSIDKQVELTKDCNGYEAFKQDIKKLKSDNCGMGLCAITANVWLKKICELKLSVLLDYVENYELGTLNAWENYK